MQWNYLRWNRKDAASVLATAVTLGVTSGIVFGIAHPVWAQDTANAPQPIRAGRAGRAPITAKRPITHDVYDTWRSIQGIAQSQDGKWVAYTLQPQDGDGELIVKNVQTSAEFRQPRGRLAAFSPDSKTVVFTIGPTKADLDKSKKAKTLPADAPKSGMGIMTLETGKVQVVERVKRWAIPEESDNLLAYLLEAPLKKLDVPAAPAAPVGETPAKPAALTPPATPAPDDEAQPPAGGRRRARPGGAAGAGGAPAAPGAAKKKDMGTDMVLLYLSTSATVPVPDVTTFEWNKNGSWLAYVRAGKEDEKDGVYAHPTRTAGVSPDAPLLTGLGVYKSLAFDENGQQLAFLSDRDDHKADTPTFKLYYWKGGSGTASESVGAKTEGVLPGMVVSDNVAPRFSKDGARLFFAVAPAPKPKPKDAPDPINVDIWTTHDGIIQPMQKVRADSERRRSFAALWNVKDKKVVPLAAPDLPSVGIDTNAPRYLLGSTDMPYQMLASWDQGYRDIYLLDMKNGERRKLLEKQSGTVSLSPGGKWLLFWDENKAAWFAQGTDGKKAAVNLTEKIKVSFAEEDHDTPDLPGPYGSAGWTDGDKTVLLYDRYDVWELSPDGGSMRCVTQGRGRVSHLVFRYAQLDPDAQAISADKPLFLDTTNDDTKATGLYRLPDLKTASAPAPLFMLDKELAGLTKAKKTDQVVFRLSRFEEYPNLWTANLNNLPAMQKISDANPQQSQYVWGKAELVHYKNSDGKPLSGVLIRPDNFDPTKKYPLMVYIYEKLSDRLHAYVTPAPGTSINVARYVSNGYVVLMPDIIYTTGYPGESAMKCVLPAIQEVVDKGYIDPARIGIQGHSWGAYQITYLVTRTNLFRAVEAGAAVSDMVSAYGGIRWTTGMSRAFQYEKTQSRIGAPPWQRPLQYIENSPIFWADKVQTPYLTIHNDGDGAVPWYQGIEFFSALRRLGKEAYLFDYNGEDHGLANRDNMKHWTVHMAEFFDHYLLGKPRAEWMDKGVPYLDRGTRDLTAFYKPAPSPAAPNPSGAAGNPSPATAPPTLLPGEPSNPIKPVGAASPPTAPPVK